MMILFLKKKQGATFFASDFGIEDDNPTPRIPNSYSCCCSCSSQKASSGDISGTKRGIVDNKKYNFPKNALFSQKWPIFKKCPIFTGPDLKRAGRTVLSAQRVRRTKSRGPKSGPGGPLNF